MVTLSSIRLGVERQQETVGLDSSEVLAIAGSGVAVYDTLDSLPMTGLSAGDEAFVKGNSRLYVSNGSGWYNISLVNRTPRWDSGGEPDASYEIADSATPLIITARAIDSDNATLLNQSSASDSAAFMATISYDSSVFTFTPKSADSIGASVAAGDLTDSNGDFIYTFKWSDGINFVSKAVTITYNVVATAVVWYGDRALATGGSQGVDDRIDYWSMTTAGNAADFGDRAVATTGTLYVAAATGNNSRAFFSGGDNSSTKTDVIEYVTTTTLGNGTDFGDLTVARSDATALSDGTYGVVAGGRAAGNTRSNVIDYITVATTGDASDFGDLLAAGNNAGSWNDATRGVVGGKYIGSSTNVIEYITIASTGNSTDFGDLSVTRLVYDGSGDTTRALWGGGYISSSATNSNVIDYITIQTTANATDFGDLTVAKRSLAMAGNGTVVHFAGGYTTGDTNVIEQVTVQTTGNASDFGDLTDDFRTPQGCSGAAA